MKRKKEMKITRIGGNNVFGVGGSRSNFDATHFGCVCEKKKKELKEIFDACQTFLRTSPKQFETLPIN